MHHQLVEASVLKQKFLKDVLNKLRRRRVILLHLKGHIFGDLILKKLAAGLVPRK